MKKCKVEGCNCKHHAKGYCKKHYLQMYRHGEILDKTRFDKNKIIIHDNYAEIVLLNKDGEECGRALIDLEDVDKVKDIKWYLSHGYAKNSNSNLLIHRLVMDCPDDKVVDHINHNRLDNRKSNLRICTHQQNMMNSGKRQSNTGYTGVYWFDVTGKYVVKIGLNKKSIHIGYFDTLEQAIEARKQAEIEYFGEYRNQDEEDVS